MISRNHNPASTPKAYDGYRSRIERAGGSLLQESAWRQAVRDLQKFELTNKIGRLRPEIGINCPANLNPIAVPLLDPLGYGNATLTGFSLSDYNAVSTYSATNLAPLWSEATYDEEEEFYTGWEKSEAGTSTANADLVKFAGLGTVRLDVDSSISVCRAITSDALAVNNTTYKISGWIYHEHATALVQPQIRYGSPTGTGTGFGQEELFKGNRVIAGAWTYFECLITKQYEDFAIWIESSTNTGSMSIWYRDIKLEAVANNAGIVGGAGRHIDELITIDKIIANGVGGMLFGGCTASTTPTGADYTMGVRNEGDNTGFALLLNNLAGADYNATCLVSIPANAVRYFFRKNNNVVGKSLGLFSLSHTPTEINLRRNNTIYRSVENTTPAGTTLKLFTHARNLNGAASFPSNHRYSFFGCGIQGSVFSETEYDTFRKIMKDLHAAFGVPANTFDQNA